MGGSLHNTFGVHLDGANTAPKYASWAATFGRALNGADPIRWVLSMSDDRDPYLMQGNMQGYTPAADASGWGTGWSTVTKPQGLVMSVPLAFHDLSLVQVANGAADAQYAKGFGFMAQSGFKQIVFRLGWEVGGTTPGSNWYPWDMPSDPANYVKAFQRVHDLAVQAIPNAKFEWNTADPTGGLASYPGDAYVDVVGNDIYLRPSDPSGFASKMAHNFAPTAAFALAHGKQVGFSEFGLNVDDPAYINGFLDQAAQLPSAGAGSLAYWMLFQGTPGDGLTYDIYAFPRALSALHSRI
jgi:hypothetical protein